MDKVYNNNYLSLYQLTEEILFAQNTETDLTKTITAIGYTLKVVIAQA